MQFNLFTIAAILAAASSVIAAPLSVRDDASGVLGGVEGAVTKTGDALKVDFSKVIGDINQTGGSTQGNDDLHTRDDASGVLISVEEGLNRAGDAVETDVNKIINDASSDHDVLN
ncbi:hypothetical protein N7456_003218 [Penicillium angulare]|uniref:Cell wall galactomannoprotein n=1 Tax=Penicillium angulare TaxID=116970 RepID=A0A9W9KIF2_9EURO|nr:hypothetical protein N7456_003218 [Penicillium angulare]